MLKMRKTTLAVGLVLVGVLALLALGEGITAAVVDTGVEKLPTSERREAELALDSARVECGDHPLWRLAIRKMRVEQLAYGAGQCAGTSSPEVRIKAHTLFGYPLRAYRVGCRSVTCGD